MVGAATTQIVQMTVRPPAQAGRFYPGDPGALARQIDGFLAAVERPAAEVSPAEAPKAIIAPHAGTIYSGPIAASAYARLAPRRDVIRRVVLLGPSHRVYLEGLAVPSVDSFRTPLGDIPIDRAACDAVAALPGVVTDDEPHRLEHSLEVHLPFLQRVLGDFALVPIVVGRASATLVDRVLEALWGGEETVVVISSGSSHFPDYATARRIDRETSALIEALDHRHLDGERACGVYPVSGLLHLAQRRGLRAECIDLRNSGDTAGDPDRVVGYGAYVLH